MLKSTSGVYSCFFFQAEDGIRDRDVTGVQTCALPISVTFTNKAAEEIGVRLKRTLGERAEEVTRGTLHALCLAILREHADAAGLHRGFGEIGRASCRERVKMWVVSVSVTKKDRTA